MEAGDITSKKRTYLGYSGVGGNCMRKIWYSFRWVCEDKASRNMNRIWDRGNLEEPRIIADLKRVKCNVHSRELGVTGITGHARGHVDGICTGVPTAVYNLEHLFEAKTMKHSSYVKYLKDGLRKYSSTYWQQIHSYMGHLNLPACLYVVTNKDTEARDYKIIPYDQAQFEEGERIAFNIITAEVPPPKMQNASKNFFECKWCAFKDVCHNGVKVDRNCRTCKYWDIEPEGKFSCSAHGHELDTQRQLEGCNQYELDGDVYE